MNTKRIAIALGLLAALAGCSGIATPQLIGSFPRYPTPTPYVAPGRIYSTSLDMEVADVAAAAQQATQLAHRYGGYLAASQSWNQDNRLHTTLTLSVPGSQFYALRASVVALGRLLDEHLVSEPSPGLAYPPPDQATVTATFSTAGPYPTVPAVPSPSWSPAGVFAQALAVLAFILTVLLDVLIWVGIVLGPFVLIGLGLRWLVRRSRRPAG